MAAQTQHRITPELMEKAKRIKSHYRACLIRVGKSPDYHIYDLRYAFLSHLRDSQAKRYLLRVKRFYDGLSDDDKAIFVAEILERDRHYPFWYLGVIRERELNGRKARMLLEAKLC